MASRPMQLHLVERAFGIAAAVAIAASIGAAAWARVHRGTVEEAPARLVAERLLRFQDLPDGRLQVSDAMSGQAVQTIEGEAGFARGTLRSLMRERRRTGVSPALPLALQAREDGRLTLADPATGQHIELDAFGPTNAAVFVRMLHPAGAPP